MTAPSDAPVAGGAVPLAWGLPNTRPCAGEQALTMVRLDVPSDDQYGGALWIPLCAALPAAEQFTAQGQDWIACSERLPEVPKPETWDYLTESVEVLILTRTRDRYIACYRVRADADDGEPDWQLKGCDGYTADAGAVTHWRPLPAPPAMHAGAEPQEGRSDGR